MSSILPFASGHHPVWSPIAGEIHDAIWDRVGREIVQGFVQEWASNWVNEFNATESSQQESLARVRQELHYPDDQTLPLIANNLPYDRQMQQAIDAILTWQPKLPALPLPPSHSPRSVAEKWAGLAAVHDVFDLTGDKVLPWPLPKDDQDLAALTEWIRGEGGAYQVLLRKAGELTETYAEPVRRWLEDVKKATPPVPLPEEKPPAVETPSTIVILDDVAPDPARISYGVDYRNVNWYGKVYGFSALQAACVKVMIEHAKHGLPDVGEQTILETADSSQKRLAGVFDNGKHPAWGTMILSGSPKGTFRIARKTEDS